MAQMVTAVIFMLIIGNCYNVVMCLFLIAITAEQLCKAYFTIILSREQKGNGFAINCAIREFGQREERTEQYNNICSHFH